MQGGKSLIEYIVSAVSGAGADAASLPNVMEIIEEMPGGFFIYRAGGEEEILYANAALLRILGCAGREEFCALTGNSFRGMVHPEDLEEVERSIREQIANSQYDLDYVEYRVICRDGQIRWLEDYGHFVRSETVGDMFYVFVGDATEKRLRLTAERDALLEENSRRAKELEAYDAQLKVIHQEHLRRLEIIEGLSIDYESIFYVDLDADAIRAYRISTRLRRQFGQGQQAVRPFSTFTRDYVRTWVCAEDRRELAAALDPDGIRSRLADRRTFLVNYRVLGKNEPEYLQMQVVNVSGGARISQVVLGARSVDEALRGEQKKSAAMADALRQSQAAVEAKNAFLSNMSHDIRTPMNAIVGFTALARKHVDDPEKLRGYLDMITASSDQLLQLLSDVLEIARIEAGRSHLEEAPCDLREVMEETRAALLPRAVEKNVSLTADMRSVAVPSVLADRQKLCQVLIRLAGNAVKYTGEGGRVSVSLEELPSVAAGYGLYRFTVADDGIGITEAFLPHIFEPFERQANTTMSGVYGTGLGLPIVKSIVDMMGGSIHVESRPGQGSRFTVTLSLRLRKGTFRPAPPPVPETALRSGEGRRILVAEDNELNREIAQELLEDAGFRVELTENGSAALERVACSRPGDYALVLMDLQMPVMDGCQAARAIRALPDPLLAGIPIIALSANTFEEDQRMSLESGMNGHLAKPIDIPTLLETIGRILGEQV